VAMAASRAKSIRWTTAIARSTFAVASPGVSTTSFPSEEYIWRTRHRDEGMAAEHDRCVEHWHALHGHQRQRCQQHQSGCQQRRPPRSCRRSARLESSVLEFFNPNAFEAQAAGTVGNERRNALYGPRYRHLDLSLFKTFPIRERLQMQFRAECFNILNMANFAVPNSSLGGANFGQITSMSTAYAPRQYQFALKLTSDVHFIT
jgi:hypothetical protein